ncbi:hypothetical protein GYMLUDRAFT_48528 [Collybiopsis luxurians FD-317 M1]|uniref:VHS domain-containing protein n=1 Tax=Collybiopsis luxurians FD-317 M1 TaxID=944289 RepID=A0A0D0BXR1_9AGAR|nr:hypothetical protein GYMLUDRAFT_48528 [Collybiopsis luxurians FD-317 M1]
MRKFFGTASKPKSRAINSQSPEDTTPPATPGITQTPIHAAHAVYPQQPQPRPQYSGLQPNRPNSVLDPDRDQSAEDLSMAFDPPPSITASRTSSFASLQGTLPPGASPPNPSHPNPNNSPSLPPANLPPLRKKQPQRDNSGGSVPAPIQAPGVLGILKALDPIAPSPNPVYLPHHTHSSSDLHHNMIPQSGRETPISMFTTPTSQQYIDEQHLLQQKDKEKSSKWNLFGRHDEGKDRERREDKDRYWLVVDREEPANANIRRDYPVEKRRDFPPADKDKETGELTRMIGFLTATQSEDWALVLEVCERASSNEANAKEAVKALRREFKYGRPASQLSAARLWAIMLRNSSDIFIAQCTQRKFLETLEDLLTNTGGAFNPGKSTSPVVRERVMDVLAAAAYASGRKDTGFRALWKRVKPHDKPEEGVPFDTDDAMFNPPMGNPGRPSYEHPPPAVPPTEPYHDPSNPPNQEPSEGKHKKERTERDKDREGRRKDRDRERDKDKDRSREHRHKDREHRHKDRDNQGKKPSRNRIIPLEEDIRRLFQECKIGLGNASLLSQALVHAKLEELKKGERGEVIKEFRLKCLSSQELIAAQIPWATAGAERSRKEKEREKQLLYGETNDLTPNAPTRQHSRDRTISNNSVLADAAGITGGESPIDEQTTEEKLLAALLEANEELLSALAQYDDLQRVAQERKAEEKSRKETRMDRRAIATLEQQQRVDELGTGTGTGGSTVHLPRSRSPSPISQRGSRPSSVIVQHPLPQHPQSLLPHSAQQLTSQTPPVTSSPEVPGMTLAPPRAPPHGPRSPASLHSAYPHGHSRSGSTGMPTSRTPSPNTPSLESANGISGENVNASVRDLNGLNTLNIDKGKGAWTGLSADDSDEEILTPIKPSAKALGKRRVEVDDNPEPPYNPDDPYYNHNRDLGPADPYDPYAESDPHFSHGGEGYNSDSDDSESVYYPNGRPRSRNGFLHHLHHPPVQFVYDAAAERTQQRLKEMETQMEKMDMEKSVEVGDVH